MSNTATQQSFMQRNQFLIRRLHSLTGILPIGVFLIAHLVTNSSLAWGWFALKGRHQGEGLSVSEGGVQYFAHEVTWINTQVPHLFLIEVTLWLAIAFHCILGFYYATGGKGNLQHYKHQDNFRYSLQRWSGYFGIFFIFYHIATLRWGWTFLIPEGTAWSHEYSASTLAAALQGSTEGWTAAGLFVSLFYLLGVSLLVFHFANGVWTAAITWGLTVSEHAQKKWGYVCAALGAGLMLAAWSALGSAMLLDYDTARAVEASILDGHSAPAIDHNPAEHALSDEVTLEANASDPEG